MTKDISNQLTLIEQKEIIRTWIQGGISAKELAENYNVSTRTLNDLVNGKTQTRLLVEKEMTSIQVAKENAKISEVKEQVLKVFVDMLDEVESEEHMIKYVRDVDLILSNVDRIQRLNAGEATERTEHTDRKLDIAEIAKTLKSVDDKKSFLLNQLKK